MTDNPPHGLPTGRGGVSRAGVLLATCGWVGYVPLAPGTAGSLVGLACYGAVRLLAGEWAQLALVAAVVGCGVWAATAAERHFGRSDPGAVVIDEVAGMLLTLLWLPVSWQGAVVGFCLFRLFDVVKPFPARRVERLSGGWGIMADDVAAAAYAHVALRILVATFPTLQAA